MPATILSSTSFVARAWCEPLRRAVDAIQEFDRALCDRLTVLYGLDARAESLLRGPAHAMRSLTGGVRGLVVGLRNRRHDGR